jgi:hypothetical protein
LLKLSLKLFFVFGVLMTSYLYFIGKDLIVFVYTEKWANDHAISILKVYSMYVGIIAINGIMEAYSNAIYSNDKLLTYNSFLLTNAILLITLSLTLPRYDLTGLVWANALGLIFRIFVNLFLTISVEKETQTSANEFDDDTKLPEIKNDQASTFSIIGILFEMCRFLRKSFLRTSAVVCTFICLIFLNIIKSIMSYDEENIILLLVSSGVIFSLNCLLIFMLEKKGFIEILRLKMS